MQTTFTVTTLNQKLETQKKCSQESQLENQFVDWPERFRNKVESKAV